MTGIPYALATVRTYYKIKVIYRMVSLLCFAFCLFVSITKKKEESFYFFLFIYLSTSNSTNDRSFLVLVAQTLTSNVSSTTVRELNDDGRLDVASGFKSSIDGANDKQIKKSDKIPRILFQREINKIKQPRKCL